MAVARRGVLVGWARLSVSIGFATVQDARCDRLRSRTVRRPRRPAGGARMLQVFFFLLGLAFSFAGVVARAPLRRPTAFFDGERVHVFPVRRANRCAYPAEVAELEP